MSKMASNRVIVPGKGSPCPRCGWPTQIREHAAITERELQKPFYYRRWFRCINRQCKTTLIMQDEFKVYNAKVAKPDDGTARSDGARTSG